MKEVRDEKERERYRTWKGDEKEREREGNTIEMTLYCSMSLDILSISLCGKSGNDAAQRYPKIFFPDVDNGVFSHILFKKNFFVQTFFLGLLVSLFIANM